MEPRRPSPSAVPRGRVVGGSPSGGPLDVLLLGRVMHQKLSSPARLKPSPAATMAKQTSRHDLAARNREVRSANTRAHTHTHTERETHSCHYIRFIKTTVVSPPPLPLPHCSHSSCQTLCPRRPTSQALEESRRRRVEEQQRRQKGVMERLESQHASAEESIQTKASAAAERHAQHIAAIQTKASNENTKVSEVIFINGLTADGIKATLNNRLREVRHCAWGRGRSCYTPFLVSNRAATCHFERTPRKRRAAALVVIFWADAQHFPAWVSPAKPVVFGMINVFPLVIPSCLLPGVVPAGALWLQVEDRIQRACERRDAMMESKRSEMARKEEAKQLQVS